MWKRLTMRGLAHGLSTAAIAVALLVAAEGSAAAIDVGTPDLGGDPEVIVPEDAPAGGGDEGSPDLGDVPGEDGSGPACPAGDGSIDLLV